MTISGGQYRCLDGTAYPGPSGDETLIVYLAVRHLGEEHFDAPRTVVWTGVTALRDQEMRARMRAREVDHRRPCFRTTAPDGQECFKRYGSNQEKKTVRIASIKAMHSCEMRLQPALS